MANDPLDGLIRAAPGLKLSTDGDLLGEYGRDWTRLHQPAPAAVAFPRDIDEIVSIVEFANAHRFALVPSGGRTGLSGGAVAANGELVVSLQAMNAMGDFDPVDRTVTVQAGVITQQLQEFAEGHGLMFPVDFASKGSSQIGGNLATNAGGIRVLRYGLMRDWVTGLKVVTGRGDILDLNRGLIKNATGYDFRHLFVGSEGTLGIIAEATMRLTRPPPTQSVMLLAATDMAAVMRIFDEARGRLTLSAFEFFSDLALDKVLVRTASRPPFEERAPFYALAEFDCANDTHEAAALECFERCAEQGLVVDGVISQSDAQAADLWALRENISESISHQIPYKNDISVRVSQAADFLEQLDALVVEHYPQFEVVWFGHIGDGNLHLNILKPDDLPVGEFARDCEAVNGVVYGLVEDFGGSVSAEHGVGLIKKPYLCHSRSTAEMDYLRGIKAVFDPNGIMNPGKLID